MAEKGPLASPNPLYAVETDHQRIQQVASLIGGVLGEADNVRFTVTEDGYGANEAILEAVEDLDIGSSDECLGKLMRSVRLRRIMPDDLLVDTDTYSIQIKEQIDTPGSDGPPSIHDITIVCPHDDSEEQARIIHSFRFPTYEPDFFEWSPKDDEDTSFNQRFAMRIKNSLLDPRHMTSFEVNDLMGLLEQARYDAPQQPH